MLQNNFPNTTLNVTNFFDLFSYCINIFKQQSEKEKTEQANEDDECPPIVL